MISEAKKNILNTKIKLIYNFFNMSNHYFDYGKN